jgi:M3 family oligoendopeptidase
MKFSDFQYVRPNIDQVKEDFNDLLKKFESAASYEEQSEIITSLNKMRQEFDSMQNICYIRHTIDTTDKYYEEEQNFFDNNTPVYQELVTQYYKKLSQSKYKSELRNKWGDQLFAIAEMSAKNISAEVIEDLKKENQLASEYTKLKASAKIDFDGKELNLAGMSPYLTHKDRSIRKSAHDKFWGFFAEHKKQFEGIYDKLVQIRTGIAKKLGFDTFTELGYSRMLRHYDADKVAAFRDAVHKYIVPVATELRARQANRLNLEKLFSYDTGLNFTTGNATPKGDPDWIVDNGKKMYAELSEETNEFFNFMLERGLMDLVNKKGKAGGGYCTFISNQSSPFIFSNFNGTSHDIDVLTHEAGHAFQAYQSKGFQIPEYFWSTYEAAEIHSMSMEFFTWPWMEYFFKEDTDKYKFSHLNNSLLFIPYGVAVDEFQHEVYANPDATPEERNAMWRSVEQKYLPHLNYDLGHLEEGAFWQKQSHIFGSPFYYIDYTLAQICAFQFWKKSRDNHEAAFADYLRLCKAGGSQNFLDLVNYANLDSPFEASCIQNVTATVQDYLESVDDMVL